MSGAASERTTHDWDAARYERFAAERRQPFDDLVALCSPTPQGTVYDLGCGTGDRTADLPDALGASRVIGVDTSVTMLQRAPTGDPRLTFEEGDLTRFDPDRPVDLVLSNAALHWVTDHDQVLASWREHLRPGGQLAVQVPVNHDHPTQRMILETADAFAEWFEPDGPPALISTNSEPPERYAEILHELGASEQTVQLRVYPHVLESTEAVVDWLGGTTLRAYRNRLDDERYARFERELTARIVDHYGDRRPFLYTFKRILFHARF